jgi:predicted PurR-regulated permease PerM
LLWWYLVTYLVNKLRRRFNVRSLWLINRTIGTILLVMAIVGIIFAVKDNVVM